MSRNASVYLKIEAFFTLPNPFIDICYQAHRAHGDNAGAYELRAVHHLDTVASSKQTRSASGRRQVKQDAAQKVGYTWSF